MYLHNHTYSTIVNDAVGRWGPHWELVLCATRCRKIFASVAQRRKLEGSSASGVLIYIFFLLAPETVGREFIMDKTLTQSTLVESFQGFSTHLALTFSSSFYALSKAYSFKLIYTIEL